MRKNWGSKRLEGRKKTITIDVQKMREKRERVRKKKNKVNNLIIK